MREASAQGASTLSGSKLMSDVSEIDVALASISSENLITASMILTELVSSLGVEGQHHLISKLLEHTQSFSPESSQRTRAASHKTQLLAQVMTKECVAPYFSSALHQAALETHGTLNREQSSCGENVAVQLCETLRADRLEHLGHLKKLSQPQLIAVATALSCAPSVAPYSDFIEVSVKLNDAESSILVAAASPNVIRTVALASNVGGACAALKSAMEMDPVLWSLATSESMRRADTECILLDNYTPSISSNENELLSRGAILVDALRDLGPTVTACETRLRVAVGNAAAYLNEADTARLIALIAGALGSCRGGNTNESQLVMQSVVADLIIDQSAEWRLNIVVDVLGASVRSLSANRVAEALDTAEMLIPPDGGDKIFEVYAALLGRPFPASVLQRTWCNREHAQLPLLAAGARLVGHNSTLVVANEEHVGGLVATLLKLSRFGHAVSCSAALDGAVTMSPEATLLALCADKKMSKLKKRLLTILTRNLRVMDYKTVAVDSVTYSPRSTQLAAEVWWSGHADLVLAALVHQSVSPLARESLETPLVSDFAAAMFACEVMKAVRASPSGLLHFDARLSLCIAAIDADHSSDTSLLILFLDQALNDAVEESLVIYACLEFVMHDAFSEQWKPETSHAMVISLQKHVSKRQQNGNKTNIIFQDAIETACAVYFSRAAFVLVADSVFQKQSRLDILAPTSKPATMTEATFSSSAQLFFSMLGKSISGGITSRAGSGLLGGAGDSDASGNLHDMLSSETKFQDLNDVTETVDTLRLDDSLSLASCGDDQQMATDVVIAGKAEAKAAASSAEGPSAVSLATNTASAALGERPLSMAELMPAASEMQPAVAPSEIVLDCVHMVFNNVSHSNLEAKVKDIAPLLHQEHFGWFANYLVVKRISTQPNFHALYLAFLEKLGADEPQQKLLKCVISAVFHNIAKLLRSSKITTSTSERSLLKNLGSWLGQITLARNRPILQRQLDVKELLYQGYESGRLIAICPFVAKILEGAKSSVVFRPPNPWLMGLMAVLRDLYDVEELKMNIKFEIEVLSKHLGIKLDEVTGPVTLTLRSSPVKDRSPDFNVKRVVGDSNADSAFSQGLTASAAQRSNLVQQRTQLQSGNFSLARDGHPVRAFTPSQNGANSGQGGSETVQQQQGSFAEQTVIPNLASYITVSAQVASGPAGATLRRVAPVAVDRAIREIIQPVVERSVTIACITTKELVTKDFATEPDEGRMRKAAQLMVSNLAGSLALVTCKEPLRVSIAKHLRALLQQQPGTNLSGNDQHDQHAVQTCAAENLDLGCMLIEKAATEKAIRDVDDALAPTFKGRQKRFEQGNGYTDMISPYGASTGRYPAALPEPLRPKSTGLLAHQFFVYEAFQRTPRQTHIQQQQAIQQTNQHHQHTQQLPQQQQMMPSSVQQQPPNIIANQSMAAQQPPHSTRGTHRGARGGAAALSLVAQQAAAERPSISISELMDAYRSATAKLDAEFASLATKMQSAAADISFAQLRNHPIAAHVGELLLAAARVERTSRDDAALAIAQSTFKAMCEQRALEPPVRLETLAIVLAAVADISAHLVRDEVANWIAFLPAHSEADRFLHAHVLVRLLGVELLDVAELDAYLARNMDGGRSQPWLDIALSFVELSVAQYRLAAFPADLQRIARVLEIVARQPHPPTALRRLVAALSADQQNRMQQHQAAAQQATAVHAAQQMTTGLQHQRHGKLAPDSGLGASKVAMGKMVKPSTQDAQDLHAYGQSVSATSAARELRLASVAPEDPVGAREQVTTLLEQWIRVWNESPGSEKAYAQYLALLQQHAVPRSEQSTERFVRLAATICVESCVESRTVEDEGINKGEGAGILSYTVVDAYAKLLILLVKYAVPDPNTSVAATGAPQRLDLLNRVLSTLTRALIADYDANAEVGTFDQRPYFRLLLNLLQDLNVPDPVLDSSNSRVLAAFATALHALQPAVAPGFAFSWLELVSHRMFMPNLLLAKNQKGWVLMHRLLVDLFVFLEPYLRKVQLSDAVRLLYKGALRVLLVLLHDFPEFLSDYHFSFCDVIPSSCIQLRNLFLSAFPRSMRLPDPFTPNLKVDLLPEISQPPRVLSNCVVALDACGLREPLDEYLQTRHPISFLLDLPRKLQAPSMGVSSTSYNVSLINSLVVHVGATAIAQLQAKSGNTQQPITHSTPMDVFQHLMNNLDSEGRYFLLNAIANQLRYPNNHTHYFSCVLLYLFAEATGEYIQEQVTRVLLERLIVHRPHPWGLLITFIELIKNPRYSFWSHGFTHCATEIERVFESVARRLPRSCMGPGHLTNIAGDAQQEQGQ